MMLKKTVKLVLEFGIQERRGLYEASLVSSSQPCHHAMTSTIFSSSLRRAVQRRILA
jgi:hypothetical protein